MYTVHTKNQESFQANCKLVFIRFHRVFRHACSHLQECLRLTRRLVSTKVPLGCVGTDISKAVFDRRPRRFEPDVRTFCLPERSLSGFVALPVFIPAFALELTKLEQALTE